jgi:hypothetical protein
VELVSYQAPSPCANAHSIFSEVHVPLEKASRVDTISVHGLTLEVTGERSVAIGSIQQCFVAVGGEGAGKHRDVSEDTLQGFIENIGHLVLEVLGSRERGLKEQGAPLAGIDANFTTSTTNIGMHVEAWVYHVRPTSLENRERLTFPEVVNGGSRGLGTDIKQYAN